MRRPRRARSTRRGIPGIARSPLYGIPVLLKDNVDTADMPTTAGSVALEGSIPPDDAFITRKLRAAGAIILGKATLTEFANFLTNGMPHGIQLAGRLWIQPLIHGGSANRAPAATAVRCWRPAGRARVRASRWRANLVAVAVGTETSGSILSPASGKHGCRHQADRRARSAATASFRSPPTRTPLVRSRAPSPTRRSSSACWPVTIQPIPPPTPVSRRATASAITPASSTRRHSPGRADRGAAVPGQPRRHHERGHSRLARAGRVRRAGYRRTRPNSPPASQDPSRRTYRVPQYLLYGFKRDLNTYLEATPDAPSHSLAEIIAFNNAFMPPMK